MSLPVLTTKYLRNRAQRNVWAFVLKASVGLQRKQLCGTNQLLKEYFPVYIPGSLAKLPDWVDLEKCWAQKRTESHSQAGISSVSVAKKGPQHILRKGHKHDFSKMHNMKWPITLKWSKPYWTKKFWSFFRPCLFYIFYSAGDFVFYFCQNFFHSLSSVQIKFGWTLSSFFHKKRKRVLQ